MRGDIVLIGGSPTRENPDLGMPYQHKKVMSVRKQLNLNFEHFITNQQAW